MSWHQHYESGLWRVWSPMGQIFEFYKGWGLRLEFELPSDWHEDQMAKIHWCFIWGNFYILFPWYKRYTDDGQCEGPRLGFYFFDAKLVLLHGNSTGRSTDRSKTFINLPWAWKFKCHTILGEKETHPYQYQLNSGVMQLRSATIFPEEREWFRYWLPSKLIRKTISIDFDDEIGEETGSWKGGCTGCGYELRHGESPLESLRRMEKERKF